MSIDNMPLPPGAIRAKCYIERHASGTWFFYSEEWRGMMLCHHDLDVLLSEVSAAGKGLLQSMQNWHAKTPYTEQKQLQQMKIYEDFFGVRGSPQESTSE
jgi:hypothetical protein